MQKDNLWIPKKDKWQQTKNSTHQWKNHKPKKQNMAYRQRSMLTKKRHTCKNLTAVRFNVKDDRSHSTNKRRCQYLTSLKYYVNRTCRQDDSGCCLWNNPYPL